MLRSGDRGQSKDGVTYAHAPESALSQALALGLHLDDSTAENGPLRVLPGTQKLGVLTDDALHALSTRITPAECFVPRGGVLAMRPLIVHVSSKSQSKAPRRVRHIEYSASSEVQAGLELAIASETEIASFARIYLETSATAPSRKAESGRG